MAEGEGEGYVCGPFYTLQQGRFMQKRTPWAGTYNKMSVCAYHTVIWTFFGNRKGWDRTHLCRALDTGRSDHGRLRPEPSLAGT